MDTPASRGGGAGRRRRADAVGVLRARWGRTSNSPYVTTCSWGPERHATDLAPPRRSQGRPTHHGFEWREDRTATEQLNRDVRRWPGPGELHRPPRRADAGVPSLGGATGPRSRPGSAAASVWPTRAITGGRESEGVRRARSRPHHSSNKRGSVSGTVVVWSECDPHPDVARVLASGRLRGARGAGVPTSLCLSEGGVLQAGHDLVQPLAADDSKVERPDGERDGASRLVESSLDPHDGL